MSQLSLGVYQVANQPDVVIPLAVDSLGRLQTTATSTISSSVEISNEVGNPIPVSGPATDAQLRAAALPVSGPVTDSQLRASAVVTEPLGVPAVARQISATNANTNTVLTSTCRRISIKARTADVRYAVGTSAQTANATTSHYIEMGERLDIAVPAGANIAVIRDTAATVNAVVCITELA